jgi:hypothetical protein
MVVMHGSILPMISSNLVKARRVGVAGVVTDLVVPRRKLRHIVFSIILHVGSVIAVATSGGMVIFPRAGVVLVMVVSCLARSQSTMIPEL